jgi:hypothetical protein
MIDPTDATEMNNDPFVKKYATLGDDLRIESFIADKVLHFFSTKKRQDIKWVKSK